MAPRLHIVIASTRPGRIGPSIARWAHETAVQHGKFDAALVDLAEVNLPLYDEPKHPSMQQYQHEHTKRWAASVAAADAFVFVTPEYNYGPTPALVNALTYVYKEWNYKPGAFVSYGGLSGGMRAVQAQKLALTSLRMVPLMDGVIIPMYAQHVDASGTFTPNELHTASAKTMLDELFRWSEALQPLRLPAAAKKAA